MNTLLKIGLLLSIAFSSLTFADSSGPVGKAMQTMMKSLQCIEGRLPATLCKGDKFAEFKTGAVQSRSALLAVHKAPDKQQMITKLFDALDAQILVAESAAKAGNQNAFKDAIAKIHEIMNAGHGALMPRR